MIALHRARPLSFLPAASVVCPDLRKCKRLPPVNSGSYARATIKLDATADRGTAGQG